MKQKFLILILLMSILLIGCSAGGPTNAEARDMIYPLIFREVTILDKRQCGVTSQMEEDRYTNVWLVQYRSEGSKFDWAVLMAESDSEEFPWVLYSSIMDVKALESICP